MTLHIFQFTLRQATLECMHILGRYPSNLHNRPISRSSLHYRRLRRLQRVGSVFALSQTQRKSVRTVRKPFSLFLRSSVPIALSVPVEEDFPIGPRSDEEMRIPERVSGVPDAAFGVKCRQCAFH
jgi:hypothetical protein